MKLKVDDTVNWRGGFGHDAPFRAKVLNIEINCHGGKYGDEVDECEWSEVTRENCIISLDNNHWAYGNQIKPIR